MREYRRCYICTAYHRDVHCDRTAQQCHQYDAECLSLYECACNLLQLSGYLIAKAHIKNFHVLEYTVTGNISFLETNVTAKMAVTALAVSIAFVIVMIEVCSTVFKKRDI